MANKKLLNEAQVRRFMGLAGISSLATNVIQEMGMGKYKRDDEDEDMKKEAMGDDEDKKMKKEMAYRRDDEEDMKKEAMYGEEEEDPADDEGGMDDGEADVDPETIQAAVAGLTDLKALLEPLASAAGIDMDMPAGGDMGGDDMDDMDDMGADDMGGEDKEDMDAELEEVSLELSEDEIVAEVTRRVAKRIIKAKRAQKALNEALGRK